MELELRIRGDVDEIEKVIQLLKGVGQETLKVTSGATSQLAAEFVQGLGSEAKEIFQTIVEYSLNGTGVEEAELQGILGREPHGIMGGLGRRWSSIAGDTYGTPFRKLGQGTTGIYLLHDDLLTAFTDVLGVSHD
jgi:hypothetical protein